MRLNYLIPATAIAVLSFFSACRKTEPLSPSPVTATAPAAYITGSGLMYFGTPYEMLNEITCTQPCGVCHVTYRTPGYFPNTNDPDNNEAIMDVYADQNQIVLSVDLHGVGQYYLNEIESTMQLPVARMTTIPQELVDEACNAAGVPRFPHPVVIPAGIYPVNMEEGTISSQLNMEGRLGADGSWSWIFSMN